MADRGRSESTNRVTALPASKGARRLPDRAAFDGLARRDNVPGVFGAREVKFLMISVDGPSPQLFFINTNSTAYHYDFATKVLGMGLSLEEFNYRTYFRDDRQNLAGSIIAHDSFEGESQKGLYSLEFWPTVPVRVAHVALAFASISDSTPFAKGNLAYHPAGGCLPCEQPLEAHSGGTVRGQQSAKCEFT